MRLPFLLPDFTRVIWHSGRARDLWRGRISAISQAWLQTERQAVVDGVRDGCLTFINPEHLVAASLQAAKKGLMVLPVNQNGMPMQYSSTATSMQAGAPWQYRIVLTRMDKAARWAEVWGQEDPDSGIGALLGYPDCCREFFDRVWVQGQGVDTTWEMAEKTLEQNSDARRRKWERGEEIIIPEGLPPEANIMLRWLGLRLVPHLPCSFTCEKTIANAKQYVEIMKQLGFHRELAWLYEMLAWPVEWSALHGIAEVRTPVNTVSTRTNATGPKLVVQRHGTAYPDEGASGLRFPFRIVTGKVTEKPAYQRAQIPVHDLNGFGSEQAMDNAHSVLLSILPSAAGSFLDLGCGTGRLLELIKDRGWEVVGVELNPTRAGAAKLPVRRGDLLDTSLWRETFDVIAFMPGRLLEGATAEKASEVRAALMSRGKKVLVYAYGDVLAKHGGLGPLVAEAGLGAGDVVASASGEGVAAALLVFTTTEDRTHVQERITAEVGHGTE